MHLVRLLGGLLGVLSLTAGAAELPRVASTNLCADQWALRLAAPEQLLSVSIKSQDPAQSSLAARARQLPANRGTVEEIIALNPDLVLASRRWQRMTGVQRLAEHGIEVLVLPYPGDWPQIFAAARLVGERIGRPDAGEALVAELEARLAALPKPARELDALYLRPNGGSAGRQTPVETVFAAAGLRNAYAEQGYAGWGRYPLEALVQTPPDLFVLSNLPGDQGHAHAAYSRHPRVQALLAERPVVHLDASRWGCSDWQLVDAAETLAEALVQLGKVRP